MAASLPPMRLRLTHAEVAPHRPAWFRGNLNNRPDDGSDPHPSRAFSLIDFYDSNGQIHFPWRNESLSAIKERRRLREVKARQDEERFAQMRKDVDRRVAEESVIRRKRLYDEMNEV